MTLTLKEKCFQYILIIVIFLCTARVLRWVFHSKIMLGGEWVFAFVFCLYCIYIWQPKVWGNKDLIWWCKKAVPIYVAGVSIGFILGIDVSIKDGFHWSWKNRWLFSTSLVLVYSAMWSCFRAIIIAKIRRVWL